MKHLVAPSVLAADFSRLKEEITMIENSEADWHHLDIMDGRFVPNISFGFPIVEAINKHANLPLDVHMMVEEPERYIQGFIDVGADIISVHQEACPHLHRTCNQIRESGAKAGVAINPSTPISVLEDVLTELDMVVIMSVNPGFGGQKFIPSSIQKVKALSDMIKAKSLDVMIEVDGGVDNSNAAALLEAGATVLVAGSAVYRAPNPLKAISDLKVAGNNTINA